MGNINNEGVSAEKTEKSDSFRIHPFGIACLFAVSARKNACEENENKREYREIIRRKKRRRGNTYRSKPIGLIPFRRKTERKSFSEAESARGNSACEKIEHRADKQSCYGMDFCRNLFKQCAEQNANRKEMKNAEPYFALNEAQKRHYHGGEKRHNRRRNENLKSPFEVASRQGAGHTAKENKKSCKKRLYGREEIKKLRRPTVRENRSENIECVVKNHT